MGESSACLVRSFSLSSPTSGEDEKENNSMQRALTTSVSFGRFVSESLDWERWSSFTHNRHLEEVERYSKPGSVAEKKAYFEAHFKRRRAAALLEQQNTVANNLPEINEINSVDDNCSSSDSDSARRDSYGKDGDIQNRDSLSSHVAQNESNDGLSETILETGPAGEFDDASESPIAMENDSNDAPMKTKLETCLSGEFEEVSEPLIDVENPLVEVTKIPENDERIGNDIVSEKEDKACNKDDSNKRILASLNEKKSKIPKCPTPGRQIRPIQIRNSVSTPNSKNIATMNSSNNRRSDTASLHMSINFATSSRKAMSPGLSKVVANLKLAGVPAKKYENSTIPQTSTRASVCGVSKLHSAAAPPAENKRTITPRGDTKSVRKTVDWKAHIPPAENRRMVTPQGVSNSVRKTVDWKARPQCSDFTKSLNTFEAKTRLPTASSPFTFKSEERAAKRKEFFQKLEQNMKLKESEKHEQRAKSQVKVRSSVKEIRKSFMSKATDNAEIPPRKEVPSNLKKKIPTEGRCSHKIEEKSSLKVEDNDSRPPWSLSAKKTKGSKKDVAGTNLHPSAKCFPKKTKENASPNIQV